MPLRMNSWWHTGDSRLAVWCPCEPLLKVYSLLLSLSSLVRVDILPPEETSTSGVVFTFWGSLWLRRFGPVIGFATTNFGEMFHFATVYTFYFEQGKFVLVWVISTTPIVARSRLWRTSIIFFLLIIDCFILTKTDCMRLQFLHLGCLFVSGFHGVSYFQWVPKIEALFDCFTS